MQFVMLIAQSRVFAIMVNHDVVAVRMRLIAEQIGRLVNVINRAVIWYLCSSRPTRLPYK